MRTSAETFVPGKGVTKWIVCSVAIITAGCSQVSENKTAKRPVENVVQALASNQVVNTGNAGQNAIPVPVTSDRTKFSSKAYGVGGSPRVAKSRRVKKGGGSYKVGKPYTIRGKRYVPQEDPDYDKKGLASWYGPNFHGRLTANGEIYDQYSLSAAHPTMPLPSYAKVTNLENGASVTVRVNDRGPYAHNRIIDLSSRAAQLLGYTKQGVAKVRVEYVGKARLDGLDEEFLVASYDPGRLNPATIPPNPGGTILVASADSPSPGQNSNRSTLQSLDANAFQPPVPEFRPATPNGFPVDISALNAPRPSGLINGLVADQSAGKAGDAINMHFSGLPKVSAPERGMADLKRLTLGPFGNPEMAKQVEQSMLQWGPATADEKSNLVFVTVPEEEFSRLKDLFDHSGIPFTVANQ